MFVKFICYLLNYYVFIFIVELTLLIAFIHLMCDGYFSCFWLSWQYDYKQVVSIFHCMYA